MAISLNTDMILDVARAADPARAQQAIDRLNGGARSGATRDIASNVIAKIDSSAGAPSVPPGSTQEQFEALLLRNMLDEMFPKQSRSFYGEGLAGDIWRSQLIDVVSTQIARTSPGLLKVSIPKAEG